MEREPIPPSEKTEVQVAEQIGRIAGKLIERSQKLNLPTHTMEPGLSRVDEEYSAMSAAGAEGLRVVEPSDSNDNSVFEARRLKNVKTESSDASGDIKISMLKSGDKMAVLTGVTASPSEVLRGQQTIFKPDQSPLTLKSNPEVNQWGAAQALGKIRSEVAKAEIQNPLNN